MISQAQLKDAVLKYYDHVVYECYVLDRSTNPIVVHIWDEDGECLVFIRIACDANGDSPHYHWQREDAEQFAGMWLFENSHLIDDIPVRFDDVFLRILDPGTGKPCSGNALLRCHKNCMADADF